MSGHPHRQTKQLSIRVMKRRNRIREMLLRGVSNQQEIAAAFGVSQPLVSKDIKAIMEEWREEEKGKGIQKRDKRIKQLEMAAKEAFDSWIKSKESKEEVSTTYTPKKCTTCYGKGKIKDTGDTCSKCNGSGEIVEEIVRRSVSGSPGDPSFLRTFNDCIKEMAKLEGLYVKKKHVSGRVEATLTHKLVQGGSLEGVPNEVLLEARAAYAQLEVAYKDEAKVGAIIEGEVVSKDPEKDVEDPEEEDGWDD